MLVIDTSSAMSACALVDGTAAAGETVGESGPAFDVAAAARALLAGRRPVAVAVATGPGSFTGLRTGAAYALGLAQGLGVPLLALGTLDLVAARVRGPATALAEAGRGRVYRSLPGGGAAICGPDELPRDAPAAGWLREATAAAIRAAGVELLAEDRLLPFGAAAAAALPRAREVPYGSLTLDYMSSFGKVAGGR